MTKPSAFLDSINYSPKMSYFPGFETDLKKASNEGGFFRRGDKAEISYRRRPIYEGRDAHEERRPSRETPMKGVFTSLVAFVSDAFGDPFCSGFSFKVVIEVLLHSYCPIQFVWVGSWVVVFSMILKENSFFI